MRKALGVFILAAVLAAPASAQMMGGSGGMSALQYYVGSWNCTAGTIGKTPGKAAATYTYDSGMLRESIKVAPNSTMKMPFMISSSTVWDAKHGRYVSTWLYGDGSWSVSYANPWTGNKETWVDHMSSSPPLGRSETTRDSHDKFSFLGYHTLTAAKPNFAGSCTRAM